LGFAGLQSGTRTNTADAQSFNAETTASVSSRALGANADIAQSLTIDSGDYNFGGVFTNSPPQGDLHDLYFAPGGSGPILGDIVGTLTSATNLGLTNLNCSTALTVNFVLMNAIRDDSAGVVTPDNTPPTGGQGRLYPYLQNDGVAQDGAPAAQSDGTNGLPAGVEEYPSFLEDIFETGGTPYYPDVRYWGGTVVANSAVTLNFMIFGPGDLAANESAPSPAYDMSSTRVGYTSITVLNDTSATASPSSITEFCSPLSTDTLLYGQSKANPCQPAGACPSGGNVIEPCSVLVVDAPPATCDSLASSGRIRWENPGAGGGESGACATECTRLFSAFHYSLRDTDGDGLENSFDACAFTSTPTGINQRSGTNDPDDDADSDMLMGGGPNGGCDPTPGTNTNSGNHDGDTFTNGDGWLNGGDNCPLIVNGSNLEDELNEPDNVRAPRGGTGTDSHGNECDTAESGGNCSNSTDDDADGLVNDGCPTSGSFAEDGCLNTIDDPDEDSATLGAQNDDSVVNDGCPSSASVATGAFYATMTVSPVCFSNSAGDDDDGDGVCDAATASDAFYPIVSTGVAIPADPNDANPSIIPESYGLTFPTPVVNSGAVAPVTTVCNDGVDNDGDTLVDLVDFTLGATGFTTNPAQCRTPTTLAYMTSDTDGDGYSDEAEVYIGTDAMGRCGVGATPSISPDWPADTADGGGASRDELDTVDLSVFVTGARPLGKNPGQAGFSTRFDVVPGPGALTQFINTLDLSQMTTFTPSMFGVKAFNYIATDCTPSPTLND
jgi:hypothetical protein